MANFLIYKYSFQRLNNRDEVFRQEGEKYNEESINRMMQETLESTFHTPAQQLNLYTTLTDKDGMEAPEIYQNKVLFSRDGVTALEIRNRKIKKITPKDSTEKVDVDDFPFCWAVIDTRPDHNFIIVQKKKETFSDAGFVAELLKIFFNNEFNLSIFDWKMKLEKRLCDGSIWDVIRMRTASGNDAVRDFSIHLNGRRTNANGEVDRALQIVLRALCATDGDLKLYSNDPTYKLLDETNKDLVELVNMLIENQYSLKVSFKRSGAIEYGKDIEAVYEEDDELVTDFGHQVVHDDDVRSTFQLILWLDLLVADEENYKYTEIKAHDGRKQSGKRKKKTA